MLKIKKFVITGGPGAGKTTLILKLEEMGEVVVHESASDHIKLRQDQGITEPWKEKFFQTDILKLQLFRESRIPKKSKRVFIDRGIIDGLAYLDKRSNEYKSIYKEAKKSKYTKVFFVESLKNVEKTKIRRENKKEAEKLAKKFKEIYCSFGFEVIVIPAVSVGERVQLILNHL